AGSNISASDVVLAAKDQVNVVNTTDTASTRSSSSTKSTSVGLSFGTNGFGISAAMANAHGDANSDAAIQNASHVTGANSVAIISGGDTNVIGSQIAGRQIAADVGGNLNIASVQDTTVSAAHQSSTGGGFTISQGGGGASFSAQNGHADGNFAQVKEQAGLYAGDGGFDVSVKSNTALTGAVIAGADDAAKNSLSTGTLTFADVGNHSHYSANSIGGSVGLSPGPSSDKAVGTASVPGSGGPVPMIGQHESGDQSATTRSAISPGTITLTDGAYQAQDIASLSRDTTNTNGTVASTPDVNEILNKQADTMQAAQAAGQVVAQGIGAYFDMKHALAVADHDQATADATAEGGRDRVIAHVIGGGLIGGLGGGGIDTAAGGAAGAGVASGFAPQLSEIAEGVGNATGSKTLGNFAANVVAGAGGALAGGEAGAVTASNADLYNRQLNQKEKKTIADQANGDAAEASRLTKAACYAVKCWAEYAPGSEQYNANFVSQLEASQLGPELAWVNNQKEAGLFNYTPGQKVTDMVKSDPTGVARDLAKTITGGVTTKTGATLCTNGLGCVVGGAMVALGLSDMAEAGSDLYNRYNGINLPGVNPLRNGFNEVLPSGWGNIAYDGLSLAAAVGALYAPVPLKMGTADGLGRPGSMFGVTVSRFNNKWLVPFTGIAAPYGVNQGILIYGVGSKGATVANDIKKAGGDK
ncbi:hemagglutinin repeat-containing protein, partial [Caballeronia sp. LZ043]|uniref:hemagglutinin repeat-containing protein n=1 Tax=Caballeronia sp. LZ043 TaxID=3038569 RepID=UPI002863A8E6